MNDFLFYDELAIIDPKVREIIDFEEERQSRKLIMIPSESFAPNAIRESLGSVLQNIYAEGYPDDSWRKLTEDEITNCENRLGYYRRYSDARYYKGVEYADILESLARRRCAELFSTDLYSPDDLFINVQPLSGAPANNAVYQALIEPGDTIMGMNLFHGGHLTHGSSVNRSGKLYKAIHYDISPVDEKIDYESIQKLASEYKPKIIIAGYSSYPWMPDWQKFREIADSIGAFLFTDISHIAGLVAAKVVPSPINYADVVSFTTHKTICGPRGACIVSTNSSISRKIDRAVFPGEQGGPHVQVFAAMATAFKIAQTEQFANLQRQIIDNCKILSNHLTEKGIRIVFGGTDTHLLNIDCKTIKGKDGTYLSGDMAARILDLVGIVANRNTIPGDLSAFKASGIRLGTPWITQRGLIEEDMHTIAEIIADVLFACEPYSISGHKGKSSRAKISFEVFENAKINVRNIIQKISNGKNDFKLGYPHHFYLDDYAFGTHKKTICFLLQGGNIRHFMNFVFMGDIEDLKPGQSIRTAFLANDIEINCTIYLKDDWNFCLLINSKHAGIAAAWLRDLSDGYIYFDKDILRRIPGPIIIRESNPPNLDDVSPKPTKIRKPFYIGKKEETYNENLPEFVWESKSVGSLKRTPLYDWHIQSKAKIVPFAGWEMPIWYSSVIEEHKVTRESAGLFDVTHMGVFQAEGPDARVFLDSICANDISGLEIGQSCYSHFLDPHANVIDDLLVYRFNLDKYFLVVNAANEEKDWAWLQAVKDGIIKVDLNYPNAHAFGKNVILRNLKDGQEGKNMRVDIAIQGPSSREILLRLPWDSSTKKQIQRLKRTELCITPYAGNELIISRTGYTGEPIAFELFFHPDLALTLWKELIKAGETYGLKPCGLGARDSLRTEAGLPLYGHEMGGVLNYGVGEAGFGSYVKTYKPWFIGRAAYLNREKNRKGEIIRFRFEEKRVRMAHLGDPVLDKRGKVIGTVTSCAIDSAEYLTGQAFVEKKYCIEDQRIYIYQNANNISDFSYKTLIPGNKISLPSAALVLKRFPKL